VAEFYCVQHRKLIGHLGLESMSFRITTWFDISLAWCLQANAGKPSEASAQHPAKNAERALPFAADAFGTWFIEVRYKEVGLMGTGR
jgi:hypothetical protein